jgi:LPS-assembly protein
MSNANIFDIQIKQSYDLYQALYGKNKNQPLSDLASLMNLYMNEITLSNQSNYYPYLSATNSTTTVTYKNALQQYFKVGYISKRSEEPRQDDVSLALGFVTSYINILTGVILDTSANRQSDSRVKKVSMIAQLKPPGECWSINFFRDQRIGLEADWKFQFNFSFDGKPTKVIPPTELNIN